MADSCGLGGSTFFFAKSTILLQIFWKFGM